MFPCEDSKTVSVCPSVRLSVRPSVCPSVCPHPEKRNPLSFVNISPTLVIDTSMERSSRVLHHGNPKMWKNSESSKLTKLNSVRTPSFRMQYQSYISNWYVNEKGFTSTTTREPKNLIFFLKFEIEFDLYFDFYMFFSSILCSPAGWYFTIIISWILLYNYTLPSFKFISCELFWRVKKHSPQFSCQLPLLPRFLQLNLLSNLTILFPPRKKKDSRGLMGGNCAWNLQRCSGYGSATVKNFVVNTVPCCFYHFAIKFISTTYQMR